MKPTDTKPRQRISRSDFELLSLVSTVAAPIAAAIVAKSPRLPDFDEADRDWIGCTAAEIAVQIVNAAADSINLKGGEPITADTTEIAANTLRVR